MYVYLFHSTSFIKHGEWLLYFNPRNETIIMKHGGEHTYISKNACQVRETNPIIQCSARRRRALTAAVTSPTRKHGGIKNLFPFVPWFLTWKNIRQQQVDSFFTFHSTHIFTVRVKCKENNIYLNNSYFNWLVVLSYCFNGHATRSPQKLIGGAGKLYDTQLKNISPLTCTIGKLN
jgi:hypothetical protein